MLEQNTKCLLLPRSEIDTLMGKYVGQEHTMYLKVCSLVEFMAGLDARRKTVPRGPKLLRQKI